jgi:chromosome segregation ATPase
MENRTEYQYHRSFAMRLKNPSRSHILKMGMASLLLMFFVSCTAAVKKDEMASNDQILAENSILKKRLPLIERENDVLSKENQQHRTRIQGLETRIQQLRAELTTVNETYAKDMAANAEKIHGLQESIQKAEKESSSRIEHLMARNKALKDAQARQERTLREQMARQKKAFSRERKQIERKHAQKEQELTSELYQLKKTIEKKDLNVSSLKLAISEISSKLGQTVALAEELKKARDRAMAELASVKSTHADPVKKGDALTHGASSQESPPGAKH